MKRQYLHGSWLLKNDRVGTLGATVPGCVHTDLIEGGVIRDLFWRDNPQDYLWVEACDWDYEYTFDFCR